MEHREHKLVLQIASMLRVIFQTIPIALTIAITSLALPVHQATAALYESYETGNGSSAGLYSPSIWVAQTFIASANHSIKYVQLYGEREASLTSGTITVAIRATDVNGHPTGPDLTAASEAVTTIPTSYNWFTIYLPTCGVTADTRYAVVVRISNAANGSEFWWSGDTVKGYPGGAGLDSADGGASWMDGGLDLLFRVYGDASAASVQTGSPLTTGSCLNTRTPMEKDLPAASKTYLITTITTILTSPLAPRSRA